MLAKKSVQHPEALHKPGKAKHLPAAAGGTEAATKAPLAQIGHGKMDTMSPTEELQGHCSAHDLKALKQAGHPGYKGEY